MDANLSEYNEEEVKRVIGIALLCTQTSPMLRPSMSRVVAMLSGDVVVSAVTTRPGYLNDWKFSDMTSFGSIGISTAETDDSCYNSTSNTTTVAYGDHSPITPTRPMLHDYDELKDTI